ncbi:MULTISPECIES: hypothetical protein [unclassified Thioalkalivibrio]|uniref:hypothetical protein n=1 Tax=unclassified Thioalkalivibrio TaxID=2621013 RepID=UPI000372A227|nr:MULTISPECIES: hypothetical protein [unclassified Thioalkalivibrio]
MAKSNRRIVNVDLSQPQETTRPRAGKKRQASAKAKTKGKRKGAKPVDGVVNV